MQEGCCISALPQGTESASCLPPNNRKSYPSTPGMWGGQSVCLSLFHTHACQASPPSSDWCLPTNSRPPLLPTPQLFISLLSAPGPRIDAPGLPGKGCMSPTNFFASLLFCKGAKKSVDEMNSVPMQWHRIQHFLPRSSNHFTHITEWKLTILMWSRKILLIWFYRR